MLDRYAACMRDHGVSGFPGPTVTANGQGITTGSGGTDRAPRSRQTGYRLRLTDQLSDYWDGEPGSDST